MSRADFKRRLGPGKYRGSVARSGLRRGYAAEFARAGATGADGSEIFEAVDPGGMPVAEINLDGVLAHGFGLPRGCLRFEHGQRGAKAGERWRGYGRHRGVGFLVALFVAGRARTFVAQVHEIVVAGVPVAPLDVHAFARRDINVHRRG